jgi:hypothetical protein
VEVSFRYIDRVSEQVIATYQQERDRWLLTQTAVRAARVRAVLGNEPVDIDATESALGYRLRQHHIGVIAWVIDEPHGSEGLTRLDRLASAAARTLGNRGRPLFVPRDEALAWIWLPLAAHAAIDRELLADAFDNGDVSARIAVGEPAYGLDGFRQTHEQAARTQGLAPRGSSGHATDDVRRGRHGRADLRRRPGRAQMAVGDAGRPGNRRRATRAAAGDAAGLPVDRKLYGDGRADGAAQEQRPVPHP